MDKPVAPVLQLKPLPLVSADELLTFLLNGAADGPIAGKLVIGPDGAWAAPPTENDGAAVEPPKKENAPGDVCTAGFSPFPWTVCACRSCSCEPNPRPDCGGAERRCSGWLKPREGVRTGMLSFFAPATAGAGIIGADATWDPGLGAPELPFIRILLSSASSCSRLRACWI